MLERIGRSLGILGGGCTQSQSYSSKDRRSYRRYSLFITKRAVFPCARRGHEFCDCLQIITTKWKRHLRMNTGLGQVMQPWPIVTLAIFLIILFISTGSPRIIDLPPGPVFVTVGNNVILPRCKAAGYPLPSFHWSKAFGDMRADTQESGVLTIHNATKSDSGLYICKVVNSIGSSTATTQLVVVSLPRFTVKV